MGYGICNGLRYLVLWVMYFVHAQTFVICVEEVHQNPQCIKQASKEPECFLKMPEKKDHYEV